MLQTILGLSNGPSPSDGCANTFCVNSITGDMAHPAGSAIVIVNPATGARAFISRQSAEEDELAPAKSTVSCLSFAPSGRYLAVGETAQSPSVQVWDVSSKTLVASMKAHKHGVSCVAFSPNSELLVSVGAQHDGQVCLWHWRTGVRVASNKVSTKILSTSFSEDGTWFVTAGTRHVKFWTVPVAKCQALKANPGAFKSEPLDGRPATLGAFLDCCYTSVAAGKGASADIVYAATSSGVLCSFANQKAIDKWVELKAERCFSIAVNDKYICCACSNGVVRLFEPVTLQYIATLSTPPALGDDKQQKDATGSAVLPHAVSVGVDFSGTVIACQYSDRSILTWEASNTTPATFTPLQRVVNPSSSIWGLEVLPSSRQLLTCSSDGATRLWNCSLSSDASVLQTKMQAVVFSEPDPGAAMMTSLKELDLGAPFVNPEYTLGCSALSLSLDGLFAAVGCQNGLLRLYDAKSLSLLHELHAHESEVTAISFSPPSSMKGSCYIATGGRDRSAHVFSLAVASNAAVTVAKESTFNDHSGSLTSLRFVPCPGNTSSDLELYLISCATDKSCVFRKLNKAQSSFARTSVATFRSGLAEICPMPNSNLVAVAGAESTVRIMAMPTGKCERVIKIASTSPFGILCMHMHPSLASLAAIGCSDKCVRVVDLQAGTVLVSLFGLADMATGVRFMLHDAGAMPFKGGVPAVSVVAASGDGAVFAWNVSSVVAGHVSGGGGGGGSSSASAVGPKLDASLLDLTSSQVTALMERGAWLQSVLTDRLATLASTMDVNQQALLQLHDSSEGIAPEVRQWLAEDGDVAEMLLAPSVQTTDTSPSPSAEAGAPVVPVPAAEGRAQRAPAQSAPSTLLVSESLASPAPTICADETQLQQLKEQPKEQPKEQLKEQPKEQPKTKSSGNSKLAEEVERTRQRLLALGIKTKPSEADKKPAAVSGADGKKGAPAKDSGEAAEQGAGQVHRQENENPNTGNAQPAAAPSKKDVKAKTPSSDARPATASPAKQSVTTASRLSTKASGAEPSETAAAPIPTGRDEEQAAAECDPVDPSTLDDRALFEQSLAAAESLRGQLDYTFLLYKHTVERQPVLSDARVFSSLSQQQQEQEQEKHQKWQDVCGRLEASFSEMQKILDDLLQPRQDATALLLDRYSSTLVELFKAKLASAGAGR